MTGYRELVEPTVIVSIFTAASLINRRRSNSSSSSGSSNSLGHDVEGGATPSGITAADDSGYSTSASSSPSLKPVGYASAGRPRRPRSLFFRLLSRFWNKYPFLPEIWYWNLTYWIYQLMRAISARLIAGNIPVFDRARAHALQILALERRLGMDMELALQRVVLTRHAWLVPALARVYYSHISVGVAFLAYAYTCTPRGAFRRVRCALAMDNALAFVVVTLWRCSPPRLLPPGYGYVDVLHGGLESAAGGAGGGAGSGAGGGGSGASAWTNNRFQLTIAAMPSLHFGTALLLAVYLWRFAPHGVVKVLAPLWPVAMLVTILATANHFLLDAMVGAVIPWFGWRYGGVMARLSVVQDWMLGPVRRRMDIQGEETTEGAKMMVD